MSAPRLETDRPCRLRGVAFVVPGFDAPAGPTRVARRLAEALAAQGVPITYVTTGAVDAARREVRGLVQVFRAPADLLEVVALVLLAARGERVEAVYGLWSLGGRVALRVAAAIDAPAVLRLTRRPTADGALAPLRRAARVLAPTASIAAEAQALLGTDTVVLTHDGVDLEEFSPRPAPAGRTLVLLGPSGDPSRAAALRAALEPVVSAREGLRLEVQVGAASAERQREALACVLPEPVDAPDPALLEALAASLPTVVARSPGAHEVVRDGVEALVSDPAPASLAAALARLLDDPALATGLASAGRARAEDVFDLAQVAARHGLLFEALKAARAAAARRPRAPALTRAALGAVARASGGVAVERLKRGARTLRALGS